MLLQCLSITSKTRALAGADDVQPSPQLLWGYLLRLRELQPK
jgi:hypothetical protein